MLRSSAAVVSRALRLLGASSRPLILNRHHIAAAPINPVRHLFLDPMPRFVADQSRGYARGRAAVNTSKDEDGDEDDEECMDSEDFDDEECTDSEDFDDEDDSDDSDE